MDGAQLFFTGDNLNAPISAFTSSAKYLYAAAENTIYAFRNMRFLACELHKHHHSITHLLGFGHSFLASVDASGLLVVWSLETHGTSQLDISFPIL